MTTTDQLTVLAIPGSLRAGSYNRAALEAAAALAPDDTVIGIHDLHGVPLYNADEEAAHGFPEAVVTLRRALAGSDALLIATPEYNFSIPGVLKNALDWLSRGSDSPLTGKPTAIMGAGGRLGTVRAQLHLREVLLHNAVPLVDSPQVMIDRAPTKFTDGALVDERHRDQITRLLTSLRDLILRRRVALPASPPPSRLEIAS